MVVDWFWLGVAAVADMDLERDVEAEVEDDVDVEPVGEFTLKGFRRPVAAFDVLGVREAAARLEQV